LVNGVIDHFYTRTPLGTTSHCSATAKSTAASTKSSPPRSVFNSIFLVTNVKRGDSSAPPLWSFLSGEYPATKLSIFDSTIAPYLLSLPCRAQLHFQPSTIWIKVKIKVTLRLAVYRQSVYLGVKLLETHDQKFYFPQLNPFDISPYVTSSLMRRWVCLL
jgi:hypothetical protein